MTGCYSGAARERQGERPRRCICLDQEATARLNRVPAGFMRDTTREEIEKVARDKGGATIDLAICEEGIGHARNTMNEVIAGYVRTKK